MPANLSPEYKSAESAYRRARDPRERLQCLRDMLRTIPKHKGTDYLQADIKHRIKELTEDLAGPQKGGARRGPATVIRPEGAAQIALLGPPNTGKSTLHDALTGSGAPAGSYPYTTQHPQPGMLPHEDIHFQLVDLPPVSAEHPVPWLAAALQPADAALLVVDLSDSECVERVRRLHELLAERRITLSERWGSDHAASADEPGDPFALRLPALLVATMADRMSNLSAELAVFEELSGLRYPFLAVSATQGAGLDGLGRWLFEHLEVVRVYTKAPGRAADKDKPFTVRRGQSVHDVAQLVHQDIACSLKYARLWGRHAFDGQHVGRDHLVEDGDVIEIHA